MSGEQASGIDRSDIIHGLFERMLAQQEALNAKVDASRAEGAERGLRMEREIASLSREQSATRNEIRNLSGRVSAVEKIVADHTDELRDLREQDDGHVRQQSETKLETQAAIGGAMAHARELDIAFGELRAVNKAICRELGLDYERAAAGDEIPIVVVTDEGEEKPKPTTLGEQTLSLDVINRRTSKLAQRSIAATVAQIVIAVGFIAELILRALGKH